MRCRPNYFSLLLFLLAMRFSSVISDTWYSCNNQSTYTDGSPYSTNLNKVGTDLVKLPNKRMRDTEKRRQLDWQKRYNIILRIARGLLYLHEDSQQKIIHRDIKAANIMLDEKHKPKIADFGLARLFPEDKTRVQTKIVAGTYGYMAPEYVIGGHLSVKADVYGFGVLLLEIISGRKIVEMENVLDDDSSDEMENLLEWAWRLYRGGDVLPMVEVVRCIHFGILCVQGDATVPPDLWKVNLMISSNTVTLPYTVSASESQVLERRVHSTIESVNEISVTDMGPR